MRVYFADTICVACIDRVLSLGTELCPASPWQSLSTRQTCSYQYWDQMNVKLEGMQHGALGEKRRDGQSYNVAFTRTAIDGA